MKIERVMPYSSDSIHLVYMELSTCCRPCNGLRYEGMPMNKVVIYPALALSIIIGSTSASYATIHSTLRSSDSTKISQDLAPLYETTKIAEKIWDKLTAEFVTLYEQGQYARAAYVAQQAHNVALGAFGPNHINTADSLLKIGIISETLGDLEAAKKNMQDAFQILRRQLGSTHEDIAVVLTNLANVYYEEGNVKQSEEKHLQALEIRKTTLGNNDPAVAQSLYNLAVLYDDSEDYEKAAPFYEQAITIWNASFGPAHPYIANALNNLANVYVAQKQYEKAEKLHKNSLAIRKLLYGEIHTEVARSLINLGALYVKQNSYEKAKTIYKEAVHVTEKLFGPSHPQVAMLLYSLANIYHIQGRMDRNEEQALSLRKVKNIKTAATNNEAELDNQITNLHKSSESYFAQALPLYERALNILDQTLGDKHPAMTAMLTELALLYKSIGKTSMAEQMQARLGHQTN